MTLLNVLLQIQATGAAAADTLNQVADSAIQAAPQTVEMSYWEMAKKGGPFIMIPMLIMSFIAVYIFIERWVAIKKASKEDTTFMDRIKDYIMDGKLDSATNLCQQANTPAARMIEKGISRLGKPMNDVLVAIENQQIGKRIQHFSNHCWWCSYVGILGNRYWYGASLLRHGKCRK